MIHLVLSDLLVGIATGVVRDICYRAQIAVVLRLSESLLARSASLLITLKKRARMAKMSYLKREAHLQVVSK